MREQDPAQHRTQRGSIARRERFDGIGGMSSLDCEWGQVRQLQILNGHWFPSFSHEKPEGKGDHLPQQQMASPQTFFLFSAILQGFATLVKSPGLEPVVPFPSLAVSTQTEQERKWSTLVLCSQCIMALGIPWRGTSTMCCVTVA